MRKTKEIQKVLTMILNNGIDNSENEFSTANRIWFWLKFGWNLINFSDCK